MGYRCGLCVCVCVIVARKAVFKAHQLLGNTASSTCKSLASPAEKGIPKLNKIKFWGLLDKLKGLRDVAFPLARKSIFEWCRTVLFLEQLILRETKLALGVMLQLRPFPMVSQQNTRSGSSHEKFHISSPPPPCHWNKNPRGLTHASM
ncbi:UNVERIFIED_CONTAM: hypothetical protein K2H54_019973 [Gekko kuhli]